MKSYEALQQAIGGKTVEHAKRLHLSASSVHKWQEPSADYTDSGSHNPLDRIETIIETALSTGRAHNDAMAPLHYLAERFDHIIIPIQKQKPSTSELSKELIKTIKEFSDLTQAASVAFNKGGEIRKSDAREIEREGFELVRQAIAFIEATKRAAK